VEARSPGLGVCCKDGIVLSPWRMPSRSFASLGARDVSGTESLIPNGMRHDSCPLRAILLDELNPHSFRMNKNMAGEPILDSQRKPIQ